MDIGIDSLQVEHGTVEDSLMIIHPPVIGLTNPTCHASQFIKSLSEEHTSQGLLRHPNMSSKQPPSPHGSFSAETALPSAVEDDKTSHATNISLHMGNGLKESNAQVSPAPPRDIGSPFAPSAPDSDNE